MARVKAMLRRSQTAKDLTAPPVEADTTLIKAGSFEIDTARHVASRSGVPLQLTSKEFELLVFLIRNLGLVFTRESLLEKLWGFDYEGTKRTVDVHVRSLRCKIEDNPAKPEYIVTVHGLGYKFCT